MIETKTSNASSPSKTESRFKLALFSLLLISVLMLSACSMSGITGKIIAGQDKCENGAIVEKVMKGKTLTMCCFSSSSENKEVEICNSFDGDYSETTIFENSEMSQRKVSYPQGDMMCSDVYGKIPGTEELVLIEDMSKCTRTN